MTRQLGTLLRYRATKSLRDPAYVLPRFIDRLFIGLIVTSLYRRGEFVLQPDPVAAGSPASCVHNTPLSVPILHRSDIGQRTDPRSINNIAAVLFMWCVSSAFGAAAVVPSLVLERKLFYREKDDGMYTDLMYLTYKVRGRRAAP